MASFKVLAITYVLGGLTFVPLTVVSILLYSYVFLPRPSHESTSTQLDLTSQEKERGDIDAKLLDRGQELDVAAGYFAVCREYVPGGVNGKPPERTTPAGETIAAESPSVYQSMYRSIFDRNKTQAPSLEGGKVVKKARNVFYVVLRHAHLLLFDNSEQLEVRHVIALSYYELDLYAGGDSIPEGELYIKRNCIRLTKKRTAGVEKPQTMPFYLFSDNCSEKEDFYHALVHSQVHATDLVQGSPIPQMFDTEDMIKLVRALHVSEENQHSRWLNALLGRLFLAIYKTSEIEALVRTKIEKKIARVPKPTFLTSLTLENIHMGNSAPTVVNPKLKEMTVDGGLILEADIKYNGSFRVVIAAVARIELGTRFKPRNVNLVLASILKRLEGHLLIRIKPPPSNRIWISFETMPKLDVSVEPIVSSRQITYGIVLRAIESRIREVIGETVVYPNWDDIPFFDTEPQSTRGGIWQSTKTAEKTSNTETNFVEDIALEDADDSLPVDPVTSSASSLSPTAVNRTSIPPSTSSSSTLNNVVTGISKIDRPQSLSDHTNTTKTSVSAPPKIMRSNSFATVATPVVTKDDHFLGDANKSRPRGVQQDATSAMKDLSIRSQDNSSTTSPASSASRSSTPPRSSLPAEAFTASMDGSELASEVLPNTDQENEERSRSSINHTLESRLDVALGDVSIESSPAPSLYSPGSKFGTVDRKAAINQSIGSATAAAKKWGMGVLSRQTEWKKPTSSVVSKDTMREPYGRGQPLPPPGMPLPRPESNSWSAAALNSLKRKPISSATTPDTHIVSDSTESDSIPEEKGSRYSMSDLPAPASTNRTELTTADNISTSGERKTSTELTNDVHLSQRTAIHYDDTSLDAPPMPPRPVVNKEDLLHYEKSHAS